MPSFALNHSTTQPLSHFEWPSRSPLEGQVRTGYDGLIESKAPLKQSSRSELHIQNAETLPQLGRKQHVQKKIAN